MSKSFLIVSWRAAGSLAMRGSATVVGKPYALMHLVNRPTATWPKTPNLRAISASRTIPTETHSPCKIVGVKTASIAWPTVCPKLTRLRNPVSRSSLVTMYALTEMLPMMMLSKICCASVRVVESCPRKVSRVDPDWTAEMISEERDSRCVNSVSFQIAAVWKW